MSAVDQSAPTQGETSFPFGMFQAIDRENWPALEAMFDPKAIYERPGYAPLLGSKEIMDFYRNVRNVRVGRHHVVNVVREAGMVVCQGRFSCHTKGGDRVNAEFCDIYSVKNDRIMRRKTYFYKEAI